MPRKLELTWDKSTKRWKKVYKGKSYHFPFGTTKDDAAGYLRALEAWRKKRSELDGASSDSADMAAWERYIADATMQQKACEREDTPANRQQWEWLQGLIGSYRRMIQLGVPADDLGDRLPIVGAGMDIAPPPWEAFRPIEPIKNDKSIGANVQRFLKRKQQQAESGERSHGHFDLLRCCLENFVEVVGGERSLGEITSGMLAGYREVLDRRIEKPDKEGKRLSPHYAKAHLASVKQFVRWCWGQDLLELPRILSSREYAMPLPEQSISVFSDDEVTRFLAACSSSTRLYLLLMLNCGFTQQDIAGLKQSEVNWENGTITRKRSKTGKHGSVPEVRYPLWDETFDLLKQHRSKNPELALTNRTGTPLKVESIVNGKAHKTDNIHSAYHRVVRKLKLEGQDRKPLKLFRKTAASKLGGHPEYGKFAQYFLGHAPQNVADKHYVRPSDEQFASAVRWLGDQFLKPAEAAASKTGAEKPPIETRKSGLRRKPVKV